MDLLFIGLASGLAGFVDAIVGGGGLILVPALFSVYPNAAPATLFGTNKSASIWGTGLATWRYSRHLEFDWRLWLGAAFATMGGAGFGAWCVTQVSADFLRQCLPIVLLVVLAYTLWRKEMGQTHAPRFTGRKQQWIAAFIGLSVGFYDGFFGPGTGSFFLFLFVRVMGYDFLNASLAAKFLNLASNVAAIALFASQGHVWWHLTIALALCNMLGSLIGTRMALQHGAQFVRLMFLLVVSALIAKTAWDGGLVASLLFFVR